MIDSIDGYKIDVTRKYLFKFSEDEFLKNSMNSEELQIKLEIKKIKNECKIVECSPFVRKYLLMELQLICEIIKK